MGAQINLTNHITISTKTNTDILLQTVGYVDIDDQYIKEIVERRNIHWIQISERLPNEAYPAIDRILEARPDITFRMFGYHDNKPVDISFLKLMPHMHRLQIDCIDFRENQNRIDFSILKELSMKAFHIECFDLRDYSFIQELSDNLEELLVMADSLGGSIQFDCRWLLRYKKLHTLWLGKKAKKNLESIEQLSNLKSLSLRGIKITNFAFLKQLQLEKLALLWNSNNDLHELSSLNSLKEIELWRINKLEDISFIEKLTNLEVIKLQDLKHVNALPDLTRHRGLKNIYLIDTGIDEAILPPELQAIIEHWDNS